MSDSQKQQRPGATPIKNPLLSASVTGLTFDDFPNKPLLLPAAPPIVHAPVPAPVVTPTGLLARDHKSLVTVGSSSSLDTENLDEINLNASNEDNQTSDIQDPNANPLLEQSHQQSSDSILSQAASSFSALPSVASNVFSTFSKRITAISSRETTPNYDQYQQDANANNLAPQLDIQPTYTQQQPHQHQAIPSQPFYAPPTGGNYFTGTSTNQQHTQQSLPPAEPPKFYTPAEVPVIPSASIAAPPTNVGVQNNFRFSSKKKLYAPIPGLSDQNQKPTLDASAVNAPISYDSSYGNIYQQSQVSAPHSAHEEQKTEERKAGSGLFSKISNLAPTGVLQNITGLVQSATGSLTQTIKTDSYQPAAPTAFDQPTNYFSGPPLPTNYFVPPSQQSNPVSVANISDNIQHPPFSNQQNQSTASQPINFFSPQPTLQTETSGTVNQPTVYPPPTSLSTTQTQIPLFNPSNLPPHINPTPSPQPTSASRPPSRPPSHASSSYLPPSSSEQSAANFFNTNNQPIQTDPSLSTGPPVTLFDPNKYLPVNSQDSANSQISVPPSSLPPTSDPKVPPPTSGHTSYRLQKGTKLYKNPLTPQETAPIHVTPNQIQTENQYPSSFTTPKSVPLFTPPTVGNYNTNINQTTQSVPLFNPNSHNNQQTQSVPVFAPPFNSNQTSQGVPLFAPQSVGNLNTNQPTQSVPLFPPNFNTNQSAQSVPLFASSAVEDLNTNQPTQSVPLFAPPTVGDLHSTNNSTKEQLFTPPPAEDFLPKSSVQNVPFSEQSQPDQTSQVFPPPLREQNNPLTDPQIVASKDTTSENFVAPPTKKHKSNESDQTVPPFSAPNEDKKSKELEANEIVDTEEPLNIKFEAQVPTQETISFFADNKAGVEPIEVNADKTESELQQEKFDDHIEETLKKLSLNTESSNTVKLPPISSLNVNSNNPYRRGSTSETSKPSTSQPILANFFTPAPSNGSDSLNFFATLPANEPGFDNSNSGINFFNQPSLHDKEPETTTFLSTSNSNTELSTTNFEEKPDLIPLQPNTAVQPPISAFFPSLPTSFGVVPAILEDKNAITEHLNESAIQGNVPPPIGFESFQQLQPTAPTEPELDNTEEKQVNISDKPENTTVQTETINQTRQPEIVNRFSNYFNQTNQQPEIAKDPSNFFDSFSDSQQQQKPQQSIEVTAPTVATNEEQRIQYFFNNPPPKEASAVGDLNYDLVHSGLGIKNLQQRSLTPISNLVEPPSSACSEFSEISNSTAGQKSIVANLSINEDIEKTNETPDNKSLDNSIISEQENLGTTESNNKHYEELPEEILKELRMANMLSADKSASSPVPSVSYKPAVKHWFFKRSVGDKHIWVPFSHYDSALLETSLSMEGDDKPNIVAVEGGRYDVNINERKKMSVYWESEPIEVRRCSWFYKAIDSKYVPYEEQTAEILENEYKQAAESGVWHKTIILGMGEQVVFHGPTVIVHFQQQQNTDAWGGTTQTATRPRVVKRDLDDFNIEQGESQKVDHLLFMVHGIGSACDLKLRSVEEVVEDFRTIARQLVQSHYKNSTDLGLVGRVEVLPISWHSHLHSVEMGIDEKLRMITLESIPKLRNFTNDTLLDILFYTSPTFCQKIMNTIVQSMNTLYLKYRERHPEFNGGVSLAGHSLGSLILFDLLCHQNPIKESEEKNLENPDQVLVTGTQMDSNQLEDNQISYTMGPAGTGQPFISYGQLIFQPKKFFALGSPIGMFVTIRGIDKLGLDFRLPTCPGFYNIFHPYDPVAYRIEALVNPDLSGVRPVLIPHHKGRKRMHLELKETMTRVSMDLKNRFLDKFKTTLDSVNIFGSTSKSTKEAEELMEKEVDKVIQMQIQLEQQNNSQNSNDKLNAGNEAPNGSTATTRQRTDSVSTAMSDDIVEVDFPLGKLNDSKRIDYVLQEAPLEFINEYIFALSSHVCYWDSEDTILFVMKEIYAGLGISPDSQVPQQSMTIERPSSRNS